MNVLFRLEILNKANEDLENELLSIEKKSVEPEDEVREEFQAEIPREVEERRPIPGQLLYLPNISYYFEIPT